MLYLETHSRDSADVELAAGVTEELIRALGSVAQLDVRSRFVSRRLGTGDPMALARQMNLGYVVTGSLEATPGRLQVHAELIRPATERLVWSQSYNRPRGDLASVVGELSQVIAYRVAGAVLPARHTAGRKGAPAPDPLAYELYVRARALYSEYSAPAYVTARDLLNESLERDSTYAPAWSLLGQVWMLGRDFGFPARESSAHATEAANRALALDSTDALALVTLATTEGLDLHFSHRAEAMVRRAEVIAPREPLVFTNACAGLVFLGAIEDGLAACHTALLLDPSHVNRINLVFRLMDARHFDEAHAALTAMDSAEPATAQDRRWIRGWIRRQQGHCDSLVVESAAQHDSLGLVQALGCAGRRAEGRALFDRWRASHPERESGFVTWFLLGEVDSAVTDIRRTLDAGRTFDPEDLFDVALDPYRRDPRLLEQMRRMGFEDGRPR